MEHEITVEQANEMARQLLKERIKSMQEELVTLKALHEVMTKLIKT